MSTPQKNNNDTSHYAQSLMIGAAGAFTTGVFGAIWYTKRKQAKYPHHEPIQQHQPAAYTPPKMTPAELELAKKDARFFALKSLTYGTLLAWAGAGVLAVGVGYWLDVRNVSMIENSSGQELTSPLL